MGKGKRKMAAELEKTFLPGQYYVLHGELL